LPPLKVLDGYGCSPERFTSNTNAIARRRKMRAGMVFALLFVSALSACKQEPQTDQNVAIDINSVSPNDIETLPADESTETPSNELANGDDDAAGNS